MTEETTWPGGGSPAPDFTLPDASGNLHRLADYAGRWLVLSFYPKDATAGLTAFTELTGG
jgi:thioredoxin-dependent peroxiredoxin